jgi:glycosyltransferase involved in cell wall biosynthesis
MIDTTPFPEVKKRVGVFHKQNRNWYRNITRHDHEDFDLKIFYDWCRLANAVRRRVQLEAKERFKYTRMPPSYPPVDLYHHWRTVDFGSTPWVVSTSAGLPFGWPGRAYREGLKLLASKACKRILVTGRCAREWQRSKAEKEPDLEHEIMQKVEVLPPAQECLVSSWKNKPIDLDGPLRLIFVGGTFFRKGGWELVQVVRQLRSESASIRLDVVSSVGQWHQMASEEQDPDEAKRIMEETDAITWHGKLPNSEVLELFRRSHIGLLPSYIETYGYTVLEAQAAGCPTITTDIKAFPDINPDEVGWRIGIDGDDYDFRSEEGRARISERIERGLYRTLKTILDDRSVIRRKGTAALERIAEEHAPARHRTRLREIYWEALNN